MATDVQPDSNSTVVPGTSRSTTSARSKPTSSRPKWVRRGLIALVLGGVVVAASIMSGAVVPESNVPLLTHTIGRRDVIVSITEQGRLESANNTEVRCKVKGANSTIVSIIENGTVVKPGDVLVRIDTSTIEDNINTQEIAYQTALSTYATTKSEVEIAAINIKEYEEGLFVSELKTKEKDVAIALANLRSAQNMLNHAKEMYRKGFMSELELQGNEYSLEQAKLELEVKETDVDVLRRFTKEKQLQDLRGILESKKAKLSSDEASLKLEKAKLDREKQQLENCEIIAESNGMVIHSRGEEWEDRPDIREGATVREDQVLLLIPDLENMQIKVGVHEALIDRVKKGMRARIEFQEKTLEGSVEAIAPMAERAGWWNGNMVKYETTIKINDQDSLKPGMSAAVEIFMAEHKNTVAIPVAAVVQQEGEYFCWVANGSETEKRKIDLGDSDDQFLVVNAGVTEGDTVVLNPIAYVDEAQRDALEPFSGLKSRSGEEEEKDQEPDSEATDAAQDESEHAEEQADQQDASQPSQDNGPTPSEENSES